MNVIFGFVDLITSINLSAVGAVLYFLVQSFFNAIFQVITLIYILASIYQIFQYIWHYNKDRIRRLLKRFKF
ncbi:MAG: hypothetical protein ACR2OT_02145 [Parvibaculales bacterium]